ncbi:efflux RND transporter periplasmic adaptor subunit [Motiliproteus sp. SC1-56]|uniref:efflux RND transporter periplasmic adaptor subunit n=1 Tax=Motiliproteus sp. SC1-56 TaxID=2799565 RepID=UPI001A8E028E|nr:efflux RND transporter periplasmic adaptor subunit [Motiliproteus sp. SC1-56]
MPLITRSLLLLLAALSAPVAPAQEAPKGLPAEVVRVQPQPLVRDLEAIGSLKANESAIISPELTGRIGAIHFQEGQPVTRGDKLFTLEDSSYRATLAEVEASRRLSQVEYDQAEQLLSRKLGSQHERDKAQAQLNIYRARVNRARTELEKMTLYAPFSGVMGLRNVSVGDYVRAGDDLVELVDLERLKVEFRVPEVYLAQINVGQTVEITTDAFPGQIFEGEIYASAPRLDERGRSLQVRARIANPDGKLQPGLFARVRLILERKDAALMLPEQAILPQGQNFFVYRVEDGKVAQVAVTLGQRSQGQVEVLSGLEAGDVVVTAGQLKLRPGAPLTPIFVDESQATAGGRS